jgi:2'-5' RNA ligase
MRLFVAIELPAGQRRRLAELPERYRWAGLERAALNWTREENLHVTLKFLGSVSDDRVPAITDALGAIRLPSPMDLRIEQLIFLPPRGPIRVFAANVGGETDRLAALQAAIELAVEPLGFPCEGRPFLPHVTLARPRRERRIASEARADVAEHQPPPGGNFAVDHFLLMNSDLSCGGPRYTPAARFPFVAPSD